MMHLTVGGEDVSGFGIYSVDISVGRDDVYSQPDGSTIQIDFIGFQSAGNVGDEIVLSDTIGQLFRGWITDVSAELQEDMSWRTTINATGPLALLGQLFAGISFYPVETDSERIKRIVDETAMSGMLLIDVTVEGFDLSERQEATNPANAAELARVAADSAMGVLWEQNSSYDLPLRYTPAKYRTWDSYAQTWGELPDGLVWVDAELQWDEVDSDELPIVNAPKSLSLDPALTYADLTFEQRLDDLVRTVQVEYGPEDAETKPEPVIAGSGQAPSKNFTTILDRRGDAVQYADTVLERQSFPSWRLSSVTMDLEIMPIERQIEIRQALEVGTKITITMPHGSPVGEMWQGFLEGWDFNIEGDGDARSFIVDMHISDRFMTEPADRWLEVGVAVLWQDIGDAVVWEDTTDVSVGS